MAAPNGSLTFYKAQLNQEDSFTNLYVKCFPQDWNEESLEALLGGCGPIRAVKLMSDPSGRKFAFVEFDNHADAKACISEYHRKDLRSRKEIKAAAKAEAEGTAPPSVCDWDGHPEHLMYVGRAQSKAERQAMFEKKGAEKAMGKGERMPKGKGKGKDKSSELPYGRGKVSGDGAEAATFTRKPTAVATAGASAPCGDPRGNGSGYGNAAASNYPVSNSCRSTATVGNHDGLCGAYDWNVNGLESGYDNNCFNQQLLPAQLIRPQQQQLLQAQS